MTDVLWTEPSLLADRVRPPNHSGRDTALGRPETKPRRQRLPPDRRDGGGLGQVLTQERIREMTFRHFADSALLPIVLKPHEQKTNVSGEILFYRRSNYNPVALASDGNGNCDCPLDLCRASRPISAS